MLITLSGVDGAGKSTLIAWLRAALERDGYRVAILHMYDDVGVYAYTRRARTQLLRLLGRTVAPPRPGARHLAPAPGAGRRLRQLMRRMRDAVVWSRAVRACVYPLDLLIFALYRIYFERLTKRILVLDRYFYDTLVDISGGTPDAGTRLLERLTPTPQVPVLLDVPPELAFGRKGEYPLDYLRRRWTAYQAVLGWVPSCVKLPNTELQQARAGLWQAVAARLPGPLGRQRRWMAGLDRVKEGKS